jgi:hypothetical protein
MSRWVELLLLSVVVVVAMLWIRPTPADIERELAQQAERLEASFAQERAALRAACDALSG